MASSLGVLRWPPEVFWKATMYEYTSGMKGYLLAKGAKTDTPVSRDEYLEMKAKMGAG